MRVDRFLSNLPRFSRQQVRLALVERRIKRSMGRLSATRRSREFSRVECDDEVLQAGKSCTANYAFSPASCIQCHP